MSYYGICAKCEWTCQGISPAMLKMALFSHVMSSRRCKPGSPSEIDDMIFFQIQELGA